MKLKVTTTYHDRKEGKVLSVGTIIERDEERAQVLIGARVAEKMEEPERQKKSSQT